MNKILTRPQALTKTEFTYCAGCQHGVIHRLMAEAIDELGIQDRTIGVYPVGCAVFAYEFFDVDGVLGAHGKAPAIATGVKRVKPECIVWAYQGDGDLAAIGIAEFLHAANRGENITVICANNAIYGMTGGQMSPTTLQEQRTTTTPDGRDAVAHGNAMRICEILNEIQGPSYIARVALIDPKHVLLAKKAIKTALEKQIEGKGLSFVEVLSACPIGWKLSPADSLKWIEEVVIPYFPLKEFRND